MDSDKPEDKKSEPEQTGGATPVEMDRIQETQKREAEGYVPEKLVALREYMTKLQEPANILAFILCLATFMLYIATRELAQDARVSGEEQGRLTRESNQINREAMAANNRAWVGPVDASVAGTVEPGKPLTIKVSVRNTGREPAKSFSWTAQPVSRGFDGPMLMYEIEQYVKRCFAAPIRPRAQVLYPSGGFGTGFDFTMEFAAEGITPEIGSGLPILLARGCISYETAGAVKHSAFCYFYKGGVTKPEHLNICNGGSDAD